MEDDGIIELYWQRNEDAITETNQKYGSFCTSLAFNILSIKEDAEECVGDTWLRAWNAIPPQRPRYLRAWLGRITRNLALSRWQKKHAQKRYAGLDALLSELEDCVPAPQTVESQWDDRQIVQVIGDWLQGLPQQDRLLFLRRYWYAQPLKELARQLGETPASLAQRMYRLRLSLRDALQNEGVSL